MEPQTDQNPKQQLVERLKAANNILVTVSTNPSVDQLAACIGLTLWLNKLGKHATAVFSGEVPSTLEFLKPEETLEKNTDSLRDFIISLDKAKADKLRYKVEDRVVKIFITPYRTNLSADDLEFSQGDFNVDAVVCLGVQEQQDLDNAITGHGRILHDATVMSINTAPNGGLGSINWHETQASSLCELVTDVGRELGKDQLDSQIATALLTGIVAETERFSNDKTVPQTMSVSAELMSAGANQQLVASKLEGEMVNLHTPEEQTVPADQGTTDNGTLEIGHQPMPTQEQVEPDTAEDTGDGEPLPEEVTVPETENDSRIINADKASKLITEPPTLGVQPLTANSMPEGYSDTTDPLSLPPVTTDEQPILKHDEPMMQAEPASQPEQAEGEEQPSGFTPPPPHWTPPAFASGSPEPALAPEPVIPAEPAPAPEPETPKVEDVPMPETKAEEPAPEPQPEPMQVPEPSAAPEPAEEKPNETLTELEQSVGAHQEQTNDQAELAENARNSLADAYSSDVGSPTAADVLSSKPADVNAETAPVEVADEPQQPAAPEPVAAPSVAFDPAAFGAINDPDGEPAAPQPLVIPGATTQPTMPTSDPQSPPPVPPPFAPSADQNNQ